MLKLFQKTIFLIILVLLFPKLSYASTLYMDPATASYGPGDVFLVDLKINTEKNCINTIETGLNFPKDYLQVLEFISGDSLINIWLKNPSKDDIIKANKEGVLKFSGGIPGGYCGRIPGDPGDSNIIGRVAFSIPGMIVGDKKEDNLSINILKSSKVLLNDGLGTEDKLDLKDLKIEFLSKKTGEGKDWNKNIVNDDILPEPFVVELYSNKEMYQGGYYIIFSTTDKQSGIDHYEVLELREGDKIGEKPKINLKDKLFGIGRPIPQWKKADIPYLLLDQELQSIIKVKAIDRNGNERIVEFIPPKNIREKVQENIKSNLIKNSLIIFIIVLLFLSFIILSIIYFKRKKNNILNNKEGD